MAFQIESKKAIDGVRVFAGSSKLADAAVAAFFQGVGIKVPAVMTGFVGDLIKNVFRLSIQFVRSVYGVLVGYREMSIDIDAIISAGRRHLLLELINLITEKLGLDELVKDLKIELPQPPFLPAGLTWPAGGEISAAPVVAALKDLLAEQAEPALAPVVDFTVSGLATRITGARAWAGPTAFTMEVHLGQLPGEVSMLFRHLMGPLWELLNDTVQKAINDAVGKALGPAADALGFAKDKVGFVEDTIKEAEAKADAARKYASNVEQKAKDLVDKLSSVQVGTGDNSDIGKIQDAANALEDAAGADPFATDEAGAQVIKAFEKLDFQFKPSARKTRVTAKKIDSAAIGKAQHKWDEAEAPGTKKAEGNGAAAKGDTK